MEPEQRGKIERFIDSQLQDKQLEQIMALWNKHIGEGYTTRQSLEENLYGYFVGVIAMFSSTIVAIGHGRRRNLDSKEVLDEIVELWDIIKRRSFEIKTRI